MADGKFVAYYRVSTAQQGHSGLGLDAQREAVMRYLSNGGWPPLAEFTEIETGADDVRQRYGVPDNPHATRLTLHILAAVAEHERDMISQRTKAALAAAKARGRVLGANGRILADQNKAEAVDRLAPIAERLRAFKAEGLTLRRIADALNADGIASPGGASWHPGNVQRALARIANEGEAGHGPIGLVA